MKEILEAIKKFFIDNMDVIFTIFFIPVFIFLIIVLFGTTFIFFIVLDLLTKHLN